MKKLLILAAVIATPAHAGDFTYPKVFTVQPTQTLEQAQNYYNSKRACAKLWTAAGIVAGTALDAYTTHRNQELGYREINPIYGKHASTLEVIAFHSATGALTYWLTSRRARDYPEKACKEAKINAGLMLLPGLINLGVTLKF